MSADRSMRALFLALKTHFPKLAEEQHKAETDALFASPLTMELQPNCNSCLIGQIRLLNI
jgi:hypothetical protein